MLLPVEQHAEEIISSLRSHNRLILNAPTGSGKSTGIPPIVYNSKLIQGKILVIQPRRIAARLLAKRVATQMNCTLGEEVGYAVRFDVRSSDRTTILFMTDGVLMRELSENSQLNGIGLIIFDEFHERRIDSDIALGYCRDLQNTNRPDLKLIVMSATLATDTLEQYLTPCDRIRVESRTFPVEIHHRAARQVINPRSKRPETPLVWQQIRQLSKDLVSQERNGDWLIFLPGVFEIRKTITELESASWLNHYNIYPLYSSLPQDQQLRAIDTPSPKIIVSTNVAETSLTIPNITTVIDSGLARESRYDPERDLESLLLRKISRASADQRAGRAGRTAPGTCYRLWSQADHAKRDAFLLPESQTKDLAPTILLLSRLGFRITEETTRCDHPVFQWLDTPSPSSCERAIVLLNNIGAFKEDGTLSSLGQQLSRFPLAPRLARLILAGAEYDCLPEATFIAAYLQGEPLVKRTSGISSPSSTHPRQRRKNPIADFEDKIDSSSFAGLWRAFEFAESNSFHPRALNSFGISGQACRELAKSYQQLQKINRTFFPTDHRTMPDFISRADAVAQAVTAAYADRVVTRLGEGTLSCRMLGNRKGKLEDSAAARTGMLFIATEIREVQGRDVLTHLSGLIQLSPQKLLEWRPESISTDENVNVNDETKSIVTTELTSYRYGTESLIIHENVSQRDPDSEEVGALLAKMIIEGNATLPLWDKNVEHWITRLNQLSHWMPELELPSISDEDQILIKQQLCAPVRRLKELKTLDPWQFIHDWLSPLQKSVLNTYAPTEITLNNGTKAKIRYSAGDPPTISVRLQKLYGVEETPKLCNSTISLRIEILAPNQRPWQITTDLASFWQNGYPQMKKDLSGRYPKHEWR